VSGRGTVSVCDAHVCAVTTAELIAMDKHWLGSLESSGWLAMVRASLVAAKEVTHLLCIKRHCVMLLGKGSTLA
jgi:hypothetical protein